MVADCFHLLPSHINTVDHADEGMANAARIVACVNACEGIADPAEAIEEARKALDMAYVQLAESIYGADQAIARHLSSAIAKLTKRA
jgi:ribosome-binding protein aMBF1 (putative translation factor)